MQNLMAVPLRLLHRSARLSFEELALVETLVDRATADRLRVQMVVTGSSN